jgi:hypothetical protein
MKKNKGSMKNRYIGSILIIIIALSFTLFVSCDGYESDVDVLVSFLDEREGDSGMRKNIDSFSIETVDADMTYVKGVGMYGRLDDGTEGYLSKEEGYCYAYVKSESGYYVKSAIDEEEYIERERALIDMLETVVSEIKRDNVEFDSKMKAFKIKDTSATVFGKDSRAIIKMRDNIVTVTIFFYADGKENKYVLTINGEKIKFPDYVSI